MIKCYTGVPGAGKSLHSIRLILAYLKDGKNVIANFPLKVDLVKHLKGKYFYCSNEEITVDFLYCFKEMYHKENEESQTLVLIDEASVKFNCRTYINKDRLEFCSFFAQHRHFGYNVVLVCQNLRQIDRQIRDLCEIEVHHRKLNNYKIFRILPFPLFVAVERNVVLKSKNDHEFFLYSKKVANLYDTYYDFTRIEKYETKKTVEDFIKKKELKPENKEKKHSLLFKQKTKEKIKEHKKTDIELSPLLSCLPENKIVINPIKRLFFKK